MKIYSAKVQQHFGFAIASLMALSPALTLGCRSEINKKTLDVELIECGKGCLKSTFSDDNKIVIIAQQSGSLEKTFKFLSEHKGEVFAGLACMIKYGYDYKNRKEQTKIELAKLELEQNAQRQEASFNAQITKLAEALEKIGEGKIQDLTKSISEVQWQGNQNQE